MMDLTLPQKASRLMTLAKPLLLGNKPWKPGFEVFTHVAEKGNVTRQGGTEFGDLKSGREEKINGYSLSEIEKLRKIEEAGGPDVFSTFLKEYYKKHWIEQLSNEEKQVIAHYSRDGSDYLNNWLRGYFKPKNSEIQQAFQRGDQILHGALQKAQLPFDLTVLRIANARILNGVKVVFTQKAEKEFILHEPGYTSTTRNTRIIFFPRAEAIKMIITLPKGTHAAFIPELSKYKLEKEVLIDKGQHFLIEDYITNVYPRIIKCVAVPDTLLKEYSEAPSIGKS